MKGPTKNERRHYNLLVGCRITSVNWMENNGQSMPVLMLDQPGSDGFAACAAVMADPEGNGPGFLEHNLKGGEK